MATPIKPTPVLSFRQWVSFCKNLQKNEKHKEELIVRPISHETIELIRQIEREHLA